MEWIVTGNIPARVGSKGSIPIEDFLENFWDYDKSPYVKEKLGKKQSIHRQYCATLLGRTRLYWIPRLAGKCVAEITRKDNVLIRVRNEKSLIWMQQIV